MKPILNTTLLAFVLASAAFADNGLDSRIVNEDGTAYSGNIVIDYNMDDTVGVENQRGGVERTVNGDTTLTGNITITGGADYATLTDEERGNHGVYLSADVTEGTVTLATGSGSDAININVYGAAATGVRNQSSGAKLVIDASGSGQAIEIHAHNTAEGARGGGAIYSSGVTEITGHEVNMSVASLGGSGIYVTNAGVVGINSEVLNISTTGMSCYAVNSAGGRIVVNTSAFNASTDRDMSNAIVATSGEVSINSGTINVETRGNLSTAVYGGVGHITLKGDSLNVTALNNSAGVVANGAGGLIEIEAGKTTLNTGREGIILYSASNADTHISVKGDVDIKSGLSGVYSQAGGLITLSGGHVSIESGSRGVNADGGDVMLSDGSVVVRSSGDAGIFAGGGSTMTGASSIDSSGRKYGAAASGAGSTVLLSDVRGMSSQSGIALYAAGGTIASLGGQAHTYKMNGAVLASDDGMVDLSMKGGSFFTGVTRFENADGLASTGTINLALAGDSMWTVTGNSQLTNLTLGQGSALQLAFSGSSLTDIISATGGITLEAGSYIYLTGDLSGLEGASFDFFDGTLVNNGVKFVGFDGSDWVEYEYTQTGANTFAFTANAPVVIEEPGFIPEPATATLGLLGLASLMMRRRRA